MMFAVAVMALSIQTAHAQDDDTWDLCPEPTQSLQNVPASPAEIQADIDRFALCLDRAELLLKIEETQNRSDELSVSAGLSGLGLPIAPQPLTQEQAASLLESGEQSTAEALPPANLPDYTIAAITGVGGDLTAQLNTPDGDIQTVRQGDQLEDGSTVSSVTASQVAARKDGDARLLQWDN